MNDELDSTRASQPRIVPAGRPPVPVLETIAFGLGGLVLGAGLVTAALQLRPKPAAPVPAPATAPARTSFAALDAVYAAWKEPPPPPACRRAVDADKLATVATDRAALGLLDPPGPEAAYLLARATFAELKSESPALSIALACPGFAAAEHLAGNLALAANQPAEAQRHFTAAVRAAPRFLEARAKLAGLLAQQGQLDEALVQTEAITTADASFAAGWLIRSGIEGKQGKTEASHLHLCRAATLGNAQAQSLAAQLHLACGRPGSP